jgi:hypothetical protein
MIAALFIGFKIRSEEIREKEKFQYQENNDQFDDDDRPELLTYGHVFKTVIIKEADVCEKFSHYDQSGLGVFEPASSTYFQEPSSCFFQMEI